MDIKDIVIISLMGLVLLINPLVSWLNSRLYKQKTELLELKIDHINKLYLPLLIVMQEYYVDKEQYKNAENIKILINNVFKINEELKKEQ